MIKFRNPGSDIASQISILKVLQKAFDAEVFSLADFSIAVTNENLMTAYGYSGNAALSLSDVEDISRNSTQMNAKMYAEIFRMLGWVSSYNDNSAYPLVITELGRYVANCPMPIRIYEQCLMGVNNPQEIMDGIRYSESVRFFLTALRFIDAVGGEIYKHDLCMGPMSVNDLNEKEFDSIVHSAKTRHGSYQQYKSDWEMFCSSQKMKPVSVDNQTRFPVGALTNVGWTEASMSRNLYAPKNLKCLKLTEKGLAALNWADKCFDVRLPFFNSCSEREQDALIRLGHFQLLGRAGFDLLPVADYISKDTEIVNRLTSGKEILFSPYQTLKNTRVEKALDIDISAHTPASAIAVGVEKPERISAQVELELCFNDSHMVGKSQPIFKEIVQEIVDLKTSGYTVTETVNRLFRKESGSSQNRFYPLVGALLGIVGFDCSLSRQGDNGSRWDAIITGPGPAMPIEIKSPAEEKFISVKAVKQALENKVILSSRKPYPSSIDAPSLVIGYNGPNNRAEVEFLISVFKKTFGFNIAVIPFDVLLTLAVSVVYEGKTFDTSKLQRTRGVLNVKAKQ